MSEKAIPEIACITRAAAEARPQGEDDWGSERQVETENRFFDMVCAYLGERAFMADIEPFAIKATTEERLDHALARCLAVRLTAREFSKSVLSEIGPERMAEAIRRNRSEPCSGVCHTHDFCDANMPMAAAYEAVFGCTPLDGDDAQQERNSALWGAAWSDAFRNEFWFFAGDAEGVE